MGTRALLPEAFVNKFDKLLGPEENQKFLASFDQQKIKGFRINPKKMLLKNQQWLQNNHPAIAWSKWGLYGQISGLDIQQVAGEIYSQEPSAQAVAELATLDRDSKVLDLCAAPGGKTTQLASQLDETGLLVANEIDGGRVRILSENVERFGYTNVIVTNHDPQSLARIFDHFFDVIVIDAPCSGEGMFRKDPTAINYWNADYPKQCQARQRMIIKSALTMLAPNGTIVYSTCTFSPEENEENIAWLLDLDPKFKVCPPPDSWRDANIMPGKPQWADGNPQLADTNRFWPQYLTGEGHFVAKLVRHEQLSKVTTSAHLTKKHTKKNQSNKSTFRKLPKDQKQQLQDWLQSEFVNIPLWLTNKTWYLLNDQVYLLPSQLAEYELSQLHIVRRGLWLGEFRKNRFIPNHALLMANPANNWQRIIEINEEQYQHFCHGETLAMSQSYDKGWYAISYHGSVFSWGYLVDRTVKNFYPKNLRR